MTDIPYRISGPAVLDGSSAGKVLYTAPAGASKFYIRDVSLTNTQASGNIKVEMSIGSIATPTNIVVSQSVAPGSTFIRPLWLMDANETFEARQTITTVPTPTSVANVTTGADLSAYPTGAWTPAAATLYLLVAESGAASGTTVLTPSSITGNGTWTAITGGSATSTVAAAINHGIATYWWYSSVGGSNATTTVNYASAQHSGNVRIYSLANTYSGAAAASPWTSTAVPYLQAASSADSVAPGSTSSSLSVTLATLQTGQVLYFCARSVNGTTTPQAGWTEFNDEALNDATGSLAPYLTEGSYPTAPPWTSATIGPATFSTSSTAARVSVAIELVPAGWVNAMVSGIEVR